MTTLNAKMSYPGMSSSYQSYYQPVHQNGFSNGHHMGSYPQNSRLTQQQQPSALQSQPSSFPTTFPFPNNNTPAQGDRWLHGVSLAQKGNKEDSSTTIKSEPSTNTVLAPSQAVPPDRSSQQPIVNNGASKPMNPYNNIRTTTGPLFPQPHGLNSYNQARLSGQARPPGSIPQPHRTNSSNQARPPGAFPQSHGLVKPQIPRTWTRAPGGVIPQAHTAVKPQIARTWVPVRQPYVGNTPRAPANLVLTQRAQNNHLKNIQQPGSSWVVTEKNFRDSSALFKQADADGDGYVSGLEVRDIFIKTGLSQENLIHIWDLVDTKQEGRLNCEQFALAMWITTRTAFHNIPPPKKLTPEMMPPSMRVKVSTPINPKQFKQFRQKETISSPNTLLSNILQYSKNGTTIPKPTAIEKPKKGTAKITKAVTLPVDDVYGCPNCSLMYDDSQHSPRQLPCTCTFCIDCIDTALDQDTIKCFKCKTSHTALAAADFPVNVFIVELLKRYLAEKSEDDRKKYFHDADACFYCVNDHEPPLKRAKVGHRKSSCDRDSSQENIPRSGCEMDKLNGKSNNIDGISEPRVNCDGSENNLNSLSVLENGSKGKEENILPSRNDISCLDTDVSKNCSNMEDSNDKNVNSHPNINKNNKEVENVAGTLNEIVDRLSGKENITENSTGVIIIKEKTLKAKVNEFDSAHLELQNKNSTGIISNKEDTSKTKENLFNTANSDLQNKWLSSIQAREKATENQRVKPKENTSKNDENMNSLSVDKFLEEIL